MSHRILDIIIAVGALVAALPLLMIGGVLVLLFDGPPVFYTAIRSGRRLEPIKVHKLRTMAARDAAGSRITSGIDNRVFRGGAFLRLTKLDELPQLVDVLIGRMAIVGPRPEDYSLAKEIFPTNPLYLELLELRPGLISPGTLYYYACLERDIPTTDAESRYLERDLPIKASFDAVYLRERSLLYDISLIFRALALIGGRLIGLKISACRREYSKAREIARAQFAVEF